MPDKAVNSSIQKFLRSEASFYISLIASVVIITISIVGTYFAMTSRFASVDQQFALLDQKLSFYVENSQKDSVAQLEKIRTIEDKVIALENRLISSEKELITLRSLFAN